jgi:hypothetical protein
MSPRARELALGALLLAGAAATLVAGLGALAQRYASREAVETRLERLLGRELALGGLTLRLSPTPTVHLHDVALGPDAQIGDLEVDLSDSALLAGRVEPDEIVARRARFTLVREADGSFGLGGGGGAPGGRGLPVLSQLEIEGSNVTWIDRTQPGLGPLEVDVERFALSDLAPGATASVELVAHPAGSTQGRVELAAHVGPLAAAPTLRGAPVSGTLRVHDFDAARVAPYLPASWQVALPQGGSFDLTAELGSRASGDFDARLDLGVRAPELRVGALALVGPARFVGNVTRRAGRVSARGERVEAAQARAAGLHALALTGTLGFADGFFDLALRPRTLRIDELELGSAYASGRLRPGDALELQRGALAADTARFRQLSGRDVAASFQVRDGVVEISDLRLTAGPAGQVSLRGRLQPGHPLKLNVDATLSDLDVLQLAAGRNDPLPTLVSGRVEVHGAWTGEPNWLAPLSGSGRVEARGGSMLGATLLPAIAGALVAAVPGSGLLPSRGRPPRETLLESATGTFAIRGGRLHTDDIQIVTGDYRVRGAGRMSHDLSLRLDGEAVLTSSGISLLGGLLRTSGLSHALRMPAIPIQIRGTLTQPVVSANVTSLPMATVRGLLGLPFRAGDAVVGVGGAGRSAVRGVGEAGGSAVRGVFGAGRRLLGLDSDSEEPAEPENAAPETQPAPSPTP